MGLYTATEELCHIIIPPSSGEKIWLNINSQEKKTNGSLTEKNII